MKCSEEELVRVLLAVRGAQPISFTARTDAGVLAKDKAKHKNPHPRPIWKTSTVNAMVNFWYDRGVLRRLRAEGKSPDQFQRGSSWHVPVTVNARLTPICRAKDFENKNRYLRVMVLSVIGEPAYHDADGKALSREDVAPFLKPQCGYENQGLEVPLVFKTYHIAGILTLTLRGFTYEVER